MASRYNEIKGLAKFTTRMIVSSEEDWKKFLHTAGHMYEKMHELIESIMLNGVLTPVIVRKIENIRNNLCSRSCNLADVGSYSFLDRYPERIVGKM